MTWSRHVHRGLGARTPPSVIRLDSRARVCEDGVGAGEGHSFKHAVSTVCMSKRRPPKHAMLRMHIDHRHERDASGKAC